MGSDPFNPITSRQRLPKPLNGILFTTVRPVASEKPFPIEGATMEGELGKVPIPDLPGLTWADSRIVAVQDAPDDQGKSLTILHAVIPSEADQLVSNWEHTTCDIGGNKFNSITRTVILPATNYNADTPVAGSAMPVVAGGLFAGEGYIYVGKKVGDSGMSLEPVFRVEKRDYVKRCTITDFTPDAQTGKANFAITTLYYRGENVGGKSVEALFADHENIFWQTDGTGYGNTGRQLSENWWEITYRQYLNTDTEDQSSARNLRNERFFQPQALATSTFVTTDYTGETPSANATVLGTSEEVIRKGRILVVKESQQQGQPKPLKGTEMDSRTGVAFVKTNELVDITAVESTTIQADGTMVTYQEDSPCEAIKVTRQAVDPQHRYWTRMMNYEWPPVLTQIEFAIFNRKDGGSASILPRIRYKKGYNQPQVASVDQWWQLDPVEIIVPQPMIPEGVHFQCPAFSISIEPCLHPQLDFSDSSGTNDPVWVEFFDLYDFPATNVTDWPDTIVWQESVPHEGGYMVTKTTLSKPA